METFALVAFAASAVVGLILAAAHLRGKTPPIPLALVHGLFGATGLVMLIVVVMRSSAAGMSVYALALFLAAALGGFVLFAGHLRKKALPRALIFGHALLAVSGFVILAVWVFGSLAR